MPRQKVSLKRVFKMPRRKVTLARNPDGSRKAYKGPGKKYKSETRYKFTSHAPGHGQGKIRTFKIKSTSGLKTRGSKARKALAKEVRSRRDLIEHGFSGGTSASALKRARKWKR